MTSTEEEYRSLPLDKLELADVSFEDFYFYSETALDRNCNALMEKGELTNKQQIQIRKVWELHPKRQQVLIQQEEREQTYIDIIQRHDQALQESKRHGMFHLRSSTFLFSWDNNLFLCQHCSLLSKHRRVLPCLC